MKHIVANNQPPAVKEFLLSLDVGPEGSIIECDGRFIHVTPVEGTTQQDHLAAIQEGIDDMNAGRTMTIEESKRRTDEALARFEK